MTDDDAPEPGAGLRHALVLVVAALLPPVYGMAAAADAAIEGFPLLLVIATTLLTAIAAALVSIVFPLPSNPEIFARIAIVVLVALGVRFTVPTPSLAWQQVSQDDAPIFSGTALLMLVLLPVAYAVGHGFTAWAARLATPARTTELAFVRDRRTLVGWFWATLLGVFVVGATRTTAGVTGSVLLVVCALVSLVVLADLRLRTPPPGATRPPIVAAPRQVRGAGVAFGLISITVITALLTPLVPLDTLRSWPRAPEWVLEFGNRDAGSELVDAVTGERPEELEDRPPETREYMENWPEMPDLPWPVLALLGAGLLLVLLRPHRWRAGLRKLLALLRRTRWLGGDDAAVGELTGLDALDDDLAEERAGAGLWRRGLERLRLRSREPRAAVLHDYLAVEKLLAKRDQGRLGPETPHEHALRVHISAAHEELSDLAADARFARAAPSPDAVARARQLRREIDQSLRQA